MGFGNYLERIIYPVGFGAFFLERFCPGTENELFVVYDCGSKSAGKKGFIKSVINTEIPRVDILFISHFHDDHINCIKELPITENTIVVLPYISDKYQALYEYVNDIHYTSLLSSLIKRGVKIIYVEPFALNSANNRGLNSNNPHNSQSYDLSETLKDGLLFHPFDDLRFRNGKWLFIPFHLQDKTIYDKFLSKALASGITAEQLVSFDGKDATLTNRLKKLYAETCKSDNVNVDFNSCSMLLVSRPEKEEEYDVSIRRYSPFSHFPKLGIFSNPACLFTGDVPLNYQPYCDTLKKLYSELMPFGVGSVQLPHHGSVNGYHPYLFDDNEVKVVFCNCIDSPSGHKPALLFKAVLEAWLNSKIFFAVTGDNDTRLEFKIK